MLEHLELSKFVTSIAVALVVALGRAAYSMLTRNRELLKHRFNAVELIDKLTSDNDWKRQEKRLVIEEAFEQLFRRPLNSHEIKTLVYSETPSAAFRTYLKYRPILEFNEKKTKFQYRKGKQPWPLIYKTKIGYPAIILKSVGYYILFGLIASFGSQYLLSTAAQSISQVNIIIFWFADIIMWLIAIFFLIYGMKFQWCDKEIQHDLNGVFTKTKI